NPAPHADGRHQPFTAGRLFEAVVRPPRLRLLFGVDYLPVLNGHTGPVAIPAGQRYGSRRSTQRQWLAPAPQHLEAAKLRGVMRVQEVHFNHDRRSGHGDAITIRHGNGAVISAPEWLDGVREPAAYALKALNSAVTIHAVFSEGPVNRAAQIQGVPLTGDRESV